LVASFLESFLKDKLKKPSKRINGHLHRVQHDILILIHSQESWQFGLVLPDRYCALWSMPQYVFCRTNLLSLDEHWVSGEGGGNNTEMLGLSNICNDNDDSEVVIEANTDHSVGDIQQGAQKVGKQLNILFRFPSKANFISTGLNQDQQWVMLGERAWCLSTCVAKQQVSVLSIVPPWDSR
jgi:hypothetical protein